MKFNQNLFGKLLLRIKGYLNNPKLLRRKQAGALLVETAVTLPVILNLMFFAIEFMRINLAESAVDTIAEEVTYAFSLSNDTACGTSEITKIIEKHLPNFLSTNNICLYVRVYGSAEKLCEKPPYGGESIGVEKSSGVVKIVTSENPLSSGADYLDNTSTSPENAISLSNLPESGQAFVVTVACRYPFSNGFTKMLFRGGKNTIGSGTSFVLWARGAGIVQ